MPNVVPKFLTSRIEDFYKRHPEYKNSFGAKRFDLVGLKSFRESLPYSSINKLVRTLAYSLLESELENNYENIDFYNSSSISNSKNLLKLAIISYMLNKKEDFFKLEGSSFIFIKDLKIDGLTIATSGCKLNFIDNLYKKEINYHVKLFSSAKIVLNLEPEKSVWDLTTMSMRGPESCMSWYDGSYHVDGEHCVKLTGSILDPSCAMIYLTDGSKTKYGEKIIARSVIRMVVDKNNQKQLFVEKVYLDENVLYEDDPGFDELSREIKNVFADFLSKKVKCPVHIKNTHNGLQIVGSDIVEDLQKYNRNFISYIDSGMNYASVPTIKVAQAQKTIQKMAAKKPIKTIKKVSKKK